MTGVRRHERAVTGSIAFAAQARELLPEGCATLAGADVAEPVSAHLVVAGRPDRAVVAALAAHVRATDATCVVAAGSGAVLDAGKLAALETGAGLVLVPCGDEPWRAFAPFSVVDDGAERPTVRDDAFATARVIVADDALAAVEDRVIAVSAVDSAVHAIESLLSGRGQPYSDALAVAALGIVADELAGDALTVTGRARVVVASGLAVEAFMATNLGLAHAVASPLGTALGVTHDTINGVLGRTAVAFADGAPAIGAVAAALRVPPRVDAVVGALDRLLDRAGLPRTLRGLGIGWPSVEGVLPAAERSSGVKAAAPGTVRAFARAAWDGGETDDKQENAWTPSR